MINGQSSSPKNRLQQNLNNINNAVGQPPDSVERIGYGIVANVDINTSQVKVKWLNEDKTPGEYLTNSYLPLINSLKEIHNNYGALRPGLLVRIYWRGKIKPNTAIIEVIGDENTSFLKKDFEINEVEVGPYFIFSGALVPIP